VEPHFNIDPEDLSSIQARETGQLFPCEPDAICAKTLEI